MKVIANGDFVITLNEEEMKKLLCILSVNHEIATVVAEKERVNPENVRTFLVDMGETIREETFRWGREVFPGQEESYWSDCLMSGSEDWDTDKRLSLQRM